jgi:hypothetical protein
VLGRLVPVPRIREPLHATYKYRGPSLSSTARASSAVSGPLSAPASSKLDDPQTLNLYDYVRNNPLSRVDSDGHCGEDSTSHSQEQNCNQVKVTSQVEQQPHVVQNARLEPHSSQKSTGVQGQLLDTVTVNGEPAANVRVNEDNVGGNTVNGQPERTNLVQGEATTNAEGQVVDKIGVFHDTDGTKAHNKQIKSDFKNNTVSSTSTQTLTLTFPSGCTCQATSTRTLTNDGPDGPNSKYTLTTTQPVVQPEN